VNALDLLGRCLAALALSAAGLVLLTLAAFLVLFLVRLPGRHPTMGPGYCAVRTLCWMFTKAFYRLKVAGLENVPAQGGALVVCNHVSYVDVVIIGVALDRPVRFLSWEGFERVPVMRRIMRMMGTIPVAGDKAKEAVQRAADALRAGELVCIFPEGHVTRNGGVQELRRGFELIARRAGVPILPMAVDGLWGSIFSFSGGKFFWKRPKHFPRPVSLVVGRPYAVEEHLRTRLRLLSLSSEAFALRPSLDGSLAREVVRGLAARAGRVVVVDRTAQRRELSGALLLALASETARHLRSATASDRVAVVLPPGIGATMANLGCLMAGKVPVNLNFTLGREQAASCLRRAGAELLVTAEAFRAKVAEKSPDFPWGDRVCDVGELLKSVPRWRLALKVAVIRLAPAAWVPALLGVSSRGGDDEAALLFTSGSSGEPKGVALSHRNLLANMRQIEDADILPEDAVLLSSLPVFHSFGFTVGVWYALSRPVRLVTLPSPLDSAAAVRAIREEKVTVVVGTPTFLRPYLRRGTKEDFASLEWAVVGAEKCPQDLVDAFRDQLDVRMLEGYGITETSPVLSVNVPDRPDPGAPGGLWTGCVTGSVGRPVIGVAVRIVSPEDGSEVEPGGTGLLEVRAPNVFGGYLGDPRRTAEALSDGWYRTGDLARMDEHGFLFLAGRLSRFSKIGGEMVPHGTVEDALRRVLKPDESAGPAFAVSASSDPVKGEQLVVLHACELDVDAVREALGREGLANLWIPKVFKKVPAVPVLGTGKLDLSRLRALAQD
jgi:acyl-[acyl-carrier-protein]-phospholipid O-acyltransferase/long-chain-fatty-acid--[acyl-carrier-protein] ligase